ncbi:MAG: hypothetical protein ACRD0B_00640 [Acidimicrobiales bacterium]
MIRCRAFGHRYRFSADGAVMRWSCQRGCGSGGTKRYGDPAEAQQYASALDREDRSELGRRAPLFGLLPLRILYWAKRRRARESRATDR